MLLENPDFVVTQLTPVKPFPFEPFVMRTKYRFIEGYRGNDTVRGWRDYDSIYHAVFADMRGSSGYPKGDPYNTVPARSAAAAGHSDRRDLRQRRHLRAEGELQDFAARTARRRPLPRDRDGGEVQRRPAARSGRGPRRLRTAIVVARHRRRPGSGRRFPRPASIRSTSTARNNKLPPPDASRLGDGLAGSWPHGDSRGRPSRMASEAGRFAGRQGRIAQRRRRRVRWSRAVPSRPTTR